MMFNFEIIFRKQEMTMKRMYLLFVLIMTLFISACGGGGGTSTPPPSTLGGIAAVGYPIVGGTVQGKCAAGSTFNSTTSNTGAWQVTLSGQTLPCAVEVSGGTINGITNFILYHSIATSTGTMNITPLTDLVVANMAAQAPSTWYAGLTGATLSPVTTTSVNTAITNLSTALSGLTPLSTTNPITTTFTATSGNTSDDMLAALQTAMTNSGTSYTTLLSAASSSIGFTTAATSLNAALPAAYAGTTSGSVPTVASFSPASGTVGASVTITGTNFSTTLANNTVKFNGTTATVTAATATSLTVTVPSGAKTGSVSVTTAGGTATSVGSFTVSAGGGTGSGIVGTWTGSITTPQNISSYTWTFNSDGTFARIGTTTIINSGGMDIICSSTGSYTVSGSMVKIPSESGSCAVGTVGTGTFSQSNGTLTVTSGGTTVTSTNDPSLTISGANLIATANSSLVFTQSGATGGTTGVTAGAPTVTSFSPSTAKVGSSITITGTNFSTTLANNTVKFNGTAATVTAATITSLTVTVPSGATAGTVSVTTAGGTAISASSFTVSISTNITPVGIQMGGARQGVALNIAANTGFTQFAGGGSITYVNGVAQFDGIGTAASFPNGIQGATTDGTNIYVIDGNQIRKIEISSGVVTTLAGNGSGYVDGAGAAAKFSGPFAITTDGTNLYVTDIGNYRIRKVVIATGVVSTFAGIGLCQSAVDGAGTTACFISPEGITTDGTNLYVTDLLRIRKVNIATAVVSTLYKTPALSSGGVPVYDSLTNPGGITTDGVNLYVASAVYDNVYKVSISTGIATLLAGLPTSTTNTSGYTISSSGSTDGSGPAARFQTPWEITTDGTNLYVADQKNNMIRKIVISTGVVSTIVGNGNPSLGAAASFFNPTAIVTDGRNVYFSMSGAGSVISKIQ